jgi:ubiquinone/menaquinone biosynthesis C-methylase UbiE
VNSGDSSVGVDFDYNLLMAAKRNLPNKLFIRANLNNEFPIKDNTFEIIVASHILEHVQSPINFLFECNRILSNNGIFILGLPIEDGLYAKLHYNYFGHPGHIYSFSKINIHKLLSITGFGKPKFIYNLARIGFRTWFNNKLNILVNKYIPEVINYNLSAEYWIISRNISEDNYGNNKNTIQYLA